jgi:hypothetical protein
MKTPAIFFGLAISACSVPAMAQNVNAIVSGSIGGIPFSLDRVNYPAATITPGTTANGAMIAVGNINFYPGAFSQELVDGLWTSPKVPATLVFTPIQYRGALGFVNGPPECFLQFQSDGVGVSPKVITQAPNGDWQLTINVLLSDNNPLITSEPSAVPYTEAQLIDASNHQLHFACAAKGPAAQPPQ